MKKGNPDAAGNNGYVVGASGFKETYPQPSTSQFVPAPTPPQTELGKLVQVETQRLLQESAQQRALYTGTAYDAPSTRPTQAIKKSGYNGQR